MTAATRILILTVLLATAGRLFAQETTTTQNPPATTTTVASETTGTGDSTDTVETTDTAADTSSSSEAGEKNKTPTIYTVRDEFTNLLREHPYEVSWILKLDPNLLSNQQFLSGYPEIAAYVDKHPQLKANPRFYLANFDRPGQQTIVGQLAEMFAVIGGFSLATFALLWLIRTFIEQKRWSRLSKTQTEVHNKILDRFSSSEELLAYIRTPAGTKFLESAPIPLHVERTPVQNAPMTRIMWSIQLGVVIAIGAIGMLLVSLRFESENAQGLFAMGAIAFSVGAGFVASALISLTMSRRLGLWQTPPDASMSSPDEPGLMR